MQSSSPGLSLVPENLEAQHQQNPTLLPMQAVRGMTNNDSNTSTPFDSDLEKGQLAIPESRNRLSSCQAFPYVQRPAAAVYKGDRSAQSSLEAFSVWSGRSYLGHKLCPGLDTANTSTRGRLLNLSRWRHRVPVYQRIFFLIFAANAFAMLRILSDVRRPTDLRNQDIAVGVAFNLLIAVMMRNEHLVNGIYSCFCVKPTLLPLRVRIAFSQVHQYGGFHSGCAIAGTMWYCLLTVLVTQKQQSHGLLDTVCLAVTWILWSLLVAIIVFAHPIVREKLHDYFEIVHRFAGWSVILLFWVQLLSIVYAAARSTDRGCLALLISSPVFWCLLLTTSLLAYPWLRIRKRQITAERLSNHAVRLHFETGGAGPCTAVKLSENPLMQNHPFACIPGPVESNAFSVIVSNAGDWTRRMIQDPPKSIWIRETPQRGVLWVAQMFSPVVIVATGSGIGPCLGLFNGCPNLVCRVVWSAQQPETTYGKGIIDAVRRADPHAIIIDTRVSGRPNLEMLALGLYNEIRAEAVVVISNRKLTMATVSALSRRGICARGPIWDS